MPAAATSVPTFPHAIAELIGIVAFRFRAVPRAWALWLVAVNSSAVAFLPRVEALVTLLVVTIALVVQAVIYRRLRFVRLLGVSHALWVPMLLWFASRLALIPAEDRMFHAWLVTLMVTNTISLIVDAIDLGRFLRGERQPHYTWQE